MQASSAQPLGGAERMMSDDCSSLGEVQDDHHAIDVLQLWNTSWFGSPRSSGSRRSAPPQLPTCSDSMSRLAQPRCRIWPRRLRPSQTEAMSVTAAHPSSGSLSGGDGSTAVPSTQLQPANSAPREIASSSDFDRQAQILQELPGIGTWAGRQRLFTRKQPLSSDAAVPDQPPVLAPTLADGMGNAVAAVPYAEDSNGHRGPRSVEGDQSMAETASSDASVNINHQAWRWRFSRKWEQEQRRAMEGPDPLRRVNSEELDALDYYKACGVGFDLQLSGRKPSRQRSRSIATGPGAGMNGVSNLAVSNSASTTQFDVDASYCSAGLLREESSDLGELGSFVTGSLGRATLEGGGRANETSLRSALPSATKQVLSVAVRARELLHMQHQIESDAAAAWERSCTAGESWAATHLEPVRIQMFGRFPYVVMRITDVATRRHLLLVRGRQGASGEDLQAAARAEVADVCARYSCALPAMGVLGWGRMEWREDTGCHLHLTPAVDASVPGTTLQQYSPRAGPSGSPTHSPRPCDVTALTASLLRQALPCEFQIDLPASSSACAAGTVL